MNRNLTTIAFRRHQQTMQKLHGLFGLPAKSDITSDHHSAYRRGRRTTRARGAHLEI